MAIALSRCGGTKCRKNSPQVTVFSQSGEATMLRAGREYGRCGTVCFKYLPAALRYAAVRGRTALPSATPTNKVENRVSSIAVEWLPRGISPLRSGFTLASVEMTF